LTMIRYLPPKVRDQYARYHGMQHSLDPASGRTREELVRKRQAERFFADIGQPSKPGPDQTYPAVGRCIYCGATSDLTDEHIVPQGLGGTLLLPKSSCRSCAAHTGAIEQRVLRGLLGAPRRILGITGRKRKQKQVVFPVTFVNDDGSAVIESVDISRHPTIIHLPIFGAPRVIRSDPLPLPAYCGVWAMSLVDLAPFRKDKEVNFRSPTIDTLEFCQFLAKIAHGFAAAEVLDLIQPCLPQFVARRFAPDEKFPGCYEHVGGSPVMYPAEPVLHSFRLVLISNTGKQYAAVQLRLFAYLGTPVYTVIIGELARDVTIEQLEARAKLHIFRHRSRS
jgi:hypothetical protein